MKFFYKSKFAGKMILLLLTFVFGTAVVKLWAEFFPPIVSVYEVAQDVERYDGQKVRLIAKAHTNGGIIILMDNVADMGNSFAGITLPENYKPASEAVREFMGEENLNFNSASVLITGRIDGKSKFSCRAPKFVIEATEIELISGVMVESQTSEKDEVLQAGREAFGEPLDAAGNLFNVNRFYVFRVNFDKEQGVRELAVEPKYFFAKAHPDWEKTESFKPLTFAEYKSLLEKLDGIKSKGRLVSKGGFGINANALTYYTDEYELALLDIACNLSFDSNPTKLPEIKYFRLNFKKD